MMAKPGGAITAGIGLAYGPSMLSWMWPVLVAIRAVSSCAAWRLWWPIGGCHRRGYWVA
jgi:hypothetical protein